MKGGHPFRPWRRRRPAAATACLPSPVRPAHEAVAGGFGEVGVAPGSAFADAEPCLPGLEPAVDHDGKVVLGRFRMPSQAR